MTRRTRKFILIGLVLGSIARMLLADYNKVMGQGANCTPIALVVFSIFMSWLGRWWLYTTIAILALNTRLLLAVSASFVCQHPSGYRYAMRVSA